MVWKEFTPRQKAWGKPVISIHRNGYLAVNSQAKEKYFKGHSHVVLFFDPEENKLGMKPVKLASRKAYKISSTAHSMSVSAKAFLDWFKIDYSKTRSFEPEKEDDLLVLKLDEDI